MLNQESNVNLIIQLLEQKNDLLRLFLEMSETERKSFKSKNYENLGSLYENREELLSCVQSVDKRLELHSSQEDANSISDENKKAIKRLLDQKQVLVNKILEQDLLILSSVENEKSNLIKKISSVSSGRRLMKAYRRLPDILD